MKRFAMLLQFSLRLGLLLALLIGFAADWVHPAPVLADDCYIQWSLVLHDTFSADYRSPGGPVTPGTTVKLRLRVGQSDITGARVRVWEDRSNAETYYNMEWDGGFDTDPATYDWWFVDVAVGAQTTVLYYFFEINDAGSCSPADQDFYTDDDPQFYGGGYGAMSDTYNDGKSFQITVYDPAFAVPDWMQGGVVYQVFPDRFRDGNPANNPPAGRFSYNTSGTIVRSNQTTWNYTVCDPRDTYVPGCTGKFGDNFYGGDLAGITEKINAGYFDALGVSVLYLNPIFRSPSNHKYDTADFMMIDPDFGTLADFQTLTAAAHAHGMKVILDGVFNHTSSDSRYFDIYHRYNSSGELVSAGIGTDDDSGACEAGASAHYPWFYFGGDYGGENGGVCPNGAGNADQNYRAWWGYGSLPKLNSANANVRSLIWSNGLNSVGPYWVSQGADGWRFDVGDDVDPGVTGDSSNNYWEGFRTAVRDAGVTGKDDTLMLGEVWGDASGLLLGNEWDSVMNYRFRSAVFGWLFTECSGNGCTGGHTFEDNDNNAGSSGGAISYLSPSLFNARLRAIEEDYPPMAWKAMMNLAGSHDTNRLRFLLKKINNGSDTAAQQRMKEWWLFSFTYAGSPTLYYGDEVALNHDAVWANNKWEDDPYNRAPYPWPDTPGNYVPVSDALSFSRKMASIRWSYPALQSGDVQHGIVIDDANKLYGFARTDDQTALIVLNRDGSAHTANLTGLNAPPYNLANDTVLYDAIQGNTYTVTTGAVSVPVNPAWGVVLLEQSEIQTPAMPVVTYTENISPVLDLVRWPAVITDTIGGREVATRYTVHSSDSFDFTPGAGNQIGEVVPSDAIALDGMLTFTTTNLAKGTYYKVCAYNAAGKSSCGVYGPTVVTLVNARTVPPLWWWSGMLLALVVGVSFLILRRRERTS